MLKQRVITAIVLALLFLMAVFGFGDLTFSLFLGLVTALCAWEWGHLSAVKQLSARLAYVAVTLLLLLLIQFVIDDDSVFRFIMLFSLLWWLGVCITLYIYPAARLHPSGISLYYLLSGPLTIVPAILSAQYLRNSELGSPWLLLLALSLVWAMDIGAYFSGKRWGKNKLAPSISPGKTVEGVLGGVALTLLLWLVVVTFRSQVEPSAFTLLMAILFAGALSVVGDLYESRAKRMTGIKDSSNILPGHGGILDRLDSAFAALPVFTFALLWL